LGRDWTGRGGVRRGGGERCTGKPNTPTQSSTKAIDHAPKHKKATTTNNCHTYKLEHRPVYSPPTHPPTHTHHGCIDSSSEEIHKRSKNGIHKKPDKLTNQGRKTRVFFSQIMMKWKIKTRPSEEMNERLIPVDRGLIGGGEENDGALPEDEGALRGGRDGLTHGVCL